MDLIIVGKYLSKCLLKIVFYVFILQILKWRLKWRLYGFLLKKTLKFLICIFTYVNVCVCMYRNYINETYRNIHINEL